MTTRLVSLGLLVSLLGLLPASLHSQVSPRALTGVVLDPSRNAVPRATVRLLDPAGVEVVQTLTDTQGRFRFDGLTQASYTLGVEMVGFEAVHQTARAGTEIELVLPLAPVRERVVVTATRTEAPTSQVGSSVTVIAAELLENRHSATLTELLRTVPGLTLVQSGPLGAITSVLARGGESDHNKVFIDGVPVNEPGGFLNFANFTPLNLNRVEVVRGPQSALFGSDALGSTIQLFTERGTAETARPRVSLALEGGKHATVRGTSRLTGQLDRFDYSLAAGRFLTNNADDNSAFRNTTLSANLGAALGERTSLRLILHGDFGTAGTPGPTAFQRPDSDAFFRRRDGLVSTAFQVRLLENWNQRVNYGYSRSRQRSRNLFPDPPPFSDFLFDSLNDTRRHRGAYQSDFTFASTQILTFAFEYEREKGRLVTIFPEFPVFSPPPVVVHRTNIGGVVQHQALLLGRLYLTGGLRIESNGSFGTEATPRLSAAYFLRRAGEGLGATKLKFNFGTGIKEPSFIESFSLSPSFRGNPDLKPERVRSFDFGVEQRFARDRAKLEINWFDNRFRDLVAFFRSSFINIGRAKAKGAEVVLELVPGWGLRGVGSYTFLNSQVLESPSPSSPVIGVGRPLLRRPRHSGSLVVLWDWRRLNLTSSLVWVGRRVDSDFFAAPEPLTSNKGYTKWDLAGSYRSSHKLTYFVVFENLLNDHYMEVLGFPALKLTFRAGARVQF